jgi:hypothetical protein
MKIDLSKKGVMMNRAILRRISLLAIILQMLSMFTAAAGKAAPLQQSANDFATTAERVDRPPIYTKAQKRRFISRSLVESR